MTMNSETIKAIRELRPGMIAVDVSVIEGQSLVRPTCITTDDLKALADSVPQWIPCEERLPEDDTYVLIFTKEPAVREGLFWDEAWYVWGNILEMDIVLAWMPLPGPYKEGK